MRRKGAECGSGAAEDLKVHTRAELVFKGQRGLQKLEFATEEAGWLHQCAAVEEEARQQLSEAEEGAMREIIEVRQLALDKAREEAQLRARKRKQKEWERAKAAREHERKQREAEEA